MDPGGPLRGIVMGALVAVNVTHDVWFEGLYEQALPLDAITMVAHALGVRTMHSVLEAHLEGVERLSGALQEGLGQLTVLGHLSLRWRVTLLETIADASVMVFVALAVVLGDVAELMVGGRHLRKRANKRRDPLVGWDTLQADLLLDVDEMNLGSGNARVVGSDVLGRHLAAMG